MPGILQNNSNFQNKKDAQAENYTHDQAESEYSRKTGILVIPIAGQDGTPPLIVKVHSAYGFRQDSFEIAKNNTQPVIPSPTATTPSGDILLTADLRFMQPRLRDQQNLLEYAVEGVYTYVQAIVRNETSIYPTQNYVHVTPEMNDNFDMDENGYYDDPTFLNAGIAGIVGGAVAASQAIKILTDQAIIQNLVTVPNPFFMIQTTSYFPSFFKPDAIV